MQSQVTSLGGEKQNFLGATNEGGRPINEAAHTIFHTRVTVSLTAESLLQMAEGSVLGHDSGAKHGVHCCHFASF